MRVLNAKSTLFPRSNKHIRQRQKCQIELAEAVAFRAYSCSLQLDRILMVSICLSNGIHGIGQIQNLSSVCLLACMSVSLHKGFVYSSDRNFRQSFSNLEVGSNM